MTRRRAVRGRCPDCVRGLCDWCDGRLRSNARAADLELAEQLEPAGFDDFLDWRPEPTPIASVTAVATRVDPPPLDWDL